MNAHSFLPSETTAAPREISQQTSSLSLSPSHCCSRTRAVNSSCVGNSDDRTLAFSWHEKSDTIKLHVAAGGENESVALLTPLIRILSLSLSHCLRLLFTSSPFYPHPSPPPLRVFVSLCPSLDTQLTELPSHQLTYCHTPMTWANLLTQISELSTFTVTFSLSLFPFVR